MSPDAVRMFRRLGLIPGPDFAPGVAAAVAETSSKEAETLLEALVDVHLLEMPSTPGRYRFHDLLRLYAQERLESDEIAHDAHDALSRMFEWYLNTADAAERFLMPGRRRLPYKPTGRRNKPAFATQEQALIWFEAERANLVAATYEAANRGLHTIAWQLPDALWTFLYLRSSWSDWRDTHHAGLAAAREAGNRQAEAWMLCTLGDLDIDLLQDEGSVQRHERSLAIFRETRDREGEIRALCGLGHGEIHLGRYEQAIDHELQALTISREIGYSYRQGLALRHLGEAYRVTGRLEEAMDCHRQALEIWRELNDRWNEGVSLNDLTKVYCDLFRFDEALDSSQRALAICREVGHHWGEGRALDLLGLILQHTDDMEAARNCWHQALAIFSKLGAPRAGDVQARLAGSPQAFDSNT